MPRIRINTERIAAVGQRLLSGSERLAGVVQEVERALAGLDTEAWGGVSRARAEPMLAQVRPEGVHRARRLEEMGRLLARVAETFSQEDEAAAQNMAGMPWVDFDTHAGWKAGEGVAVKTSDAPPASSLSPAGLTFIARQEGMVLSLYNDPAGNCTVGIGHLVHIGPCDGRPAEAEFQNGLTEEQAYDLLRSDVALGERVVRTFVHVPLTQHQFDALTSFTFNVGAGNMIDSDLLAKLNQGDYESVPDELNQWILDEDGVILPGLVRRRQEEGALFRGDTD